MIGRRAPRRQMNWFDRMAYEPERSYRGKHEKHTLRGKLLGFFAAWFGVFLIGLMWFEGVI